MDNSVKQSGATEQRNDGWALVPINPTIEMMEAWHRAYEKGQWNADSWESAFSLAHKAMIAASPPSRLVVCKDEPIYQGTTATGWADFTKEAWEQKLSKYRRIVYAKTD